VARLVADLSNGINQQTPRRTTRGLLLVAVVLAFTAFTAESAVAAETASSDVVIIREDVVVDDDLYATGLRVVIEGRVEGDLIAFAAEEVVIEGVVTGSVFAVTQRVSVSGEVGESLRVSATSVEVSGSVGKDLVVASLRLDVTEDAEIGGDVLVWAWDASVSGTIGGDMTATQRKLELAGSVEGEVKVTVTHLTITGPLTVGGDLAYRSDSPATGLEQADVGGVVVHQTPLAPNIRVRALGLLGRALVALALTATSILVALGWPARTEHAAKRARSNSLRSYGIGFLVIFSPILIIGVGALIVGLAPAAASLPLLAILVPVAVVMAGLVMAFSLVAGAPSVLMLGRLLRANLGTYGAIVAGSAVVSLVWFLPVVGWLVPLTVLPLGAGSWIVASLRTPD